MASRLKLDIACGDAHVHGGMYIYAHVYGSPLGPFHMRNSSVYARTASVRVCSWNCSCPICSRSAIIEIELDLALGTAKIENILR